MVRLGEANSSALAPVGGAEKAARIFSVTTPDITLKSSVLVAVGVVTGAGGGGGPLLVPGG